MTEQFTHASQELINKAVALARHAHNPTFTVLHILCAALQDSFCQSFFSELTISIKDLLAVVEAELKKLPKTQGASEITAGSDVQTFLQVAQGYAQKLGDTYISLEHFLLAFSSLKELPAPVKSFFKDHHFTEKKIMDVMDKWRQGKKVNNKTAENNYQALEKYSINLTQQARSGKLDPVIGRNEEIRRVIQILSRRTKNNPVLIGEPGVGKTAIVEGIAQRIINEDVPDSLQNKQIFALDLGLLIAGAKYQGEFEDRLKSVLKTVEDSQGNIILFIDELHMLVGAGSSGGGMDASNLLKPALARGSLHCIGATTVKEYKKYIEKDAALERRFQKVLVPEPSIEDALSILRGLKERYELHHGIRIKDQALVDAVQLSAQNIADRFLPDKAIDLVDEAAAMVKMSIDSQPEKLDKLDRKIRQLEIEKVALSKEKDDPVSTKRLQELEEELANVKEEYNQFFAQWRAEKAPLEKINNLMEEIETVTYAFQEAERQGDFAKASEIKYGTITKLKAALARAQEELKESNPRLIKQLVDEHDIAQVLSRWTKIPLEKLQATESQKLLQMQSILQQRVVGQDEAIEKITQAIQVHRAGLADSNRPIGSFIFLGPTGVGKTEVAKTLADFLFNDEHKLLRIDMSEYMEKHAVARLIGSPPGYVGYEEGGQLTEQVRRNPYSVILFDEIEKAHSDVFNIFLQILDEGHLTDSQGRTVSFKNCIIIMTSNIGSHIILDAPTIDDAVKKNIEEQLHQHFKPEFLNRIDSIVFFKRLSKSDVERIAQMHVKALQEKLLERQVVLHVDKAVVEKIADLGYVPEFGARPLKRVIQQHLVVLLAQYLLKHPETKEITVGLRDDQIVIK